MNQLHKTVIFSLIVYSCTIQMHFNRIAECDNPLLPQHTKQQQQKSTTSATQKPLRLLSFSVCTQFLSCLLSIRYVCWVRLIAYIRLVFLVGGCWGGFNNNVNSPSTYFSVTCIQKTYCYNYAFNITIDMIEIDYAYYVWVERKI